MFTGTMLAVLTISLIPAVSAQSSICYDRLGNPYRCYDSGLSYTQRVGIGIGVAALIVLLFAMCGYWRRKQLQKQFARYRPPALPYQGGPGQEGGQGQYNYGQGNNPYANNPPPPTGYQGQQSSFGGPNQYGNNPPPPASTYQPSMAGQYGHGNGHGSQQAKSNAGGDGQSEHEHGYEWEQAREAERLERERQHGGGEVPPGYDVSNTAATTPVVTGTQGGNDAYAPPPGAPPTKRT